MDPNQLAGIYHTYVETITASEYRRQQTTAVFLALIGAALAGIGALKALPTFIPILAALVLAVLWRQKIHYFQRLAKAKWAIVFELEDLLPVQPFKNEYAKLKETDASAPTPSRRLTDIEKMVPTIVIIFCLCFLIYEIVTFSCDWFSWNLRICKP